MDGGQGRTSRVEALQGSESHRGIREAMTPPAFEVTLWGTRGSLPVSGPDFAVFGGNTACVEMRCGDRTLLFDAGSGIPVAGVALRSRGVEDIALLFSHFHYDHLMGLPFFLPIYDKDVRLRVWSGHAPAMRTEAMFGEFMREPFFPIGPDKCCAHIECADFRAGDVLRPWPEVRIRTAMLNHPGNAIGYRVEFAGRAIAIVTDTEHDPGHFDPAVLALIENVDLFLYDTTFEDAEMATFRGFGHSTWEQAIRLAEASGARSVGFVHHAKFRTDDDLLRIEAEAQCLFPRSFCGRDGQVIAV